ncbi:MAG: DUF4920 domain-containing protein [Azospira oryzae]|nr:DUF4920 domain-containing protein [Cytophaga sp.]PZR37892.1 MAG: DUF4920 domain-containing protein [Azospira oryzae]
MKNVFLFSFLMIAGIAVYAQPPQVPANAGATFGAVVTPEGAVPVGQVPSLLASKESAHMKVTAKVIDVCPKKGCWMQLEMPDQSKMLVKFKDYGFFVPTAMIGKTVVIDGEAKTVVTSVDELKHYAEDAKKSKEEIAAITAPKKEIRFTADGVLVTK